MTPERDIGSWLDGVGLQKYRQRFADNEVDFDVLDTLTNEDLKELAIPLGDRKRLLAAIAELSDAHTEPATENVEMDDTERRQITVLFCDMVGFTEFATVLDPEDLEELVSRFLTICGGQVAEWGGHVANYLGDGLLAFFGWPLSFEDAADRSIQAALSIIRNVPEIDAPAGARINARIGVATGLVLVGGKYGKGSAMTETAFGATPNLAARLETLAEPGEVLIAASTRALLSNAFSLENTGEHDLKGFAEPVEVWKVQGVVDTPTRARRQDSTAGVQLVGRSVQIRQLHRQWTEVVSGGCARQTLVTAEAGMGKTRLVDHFRTELKDQKHNVALMQCWPYRSDATLYPVIDYLKISAGCTREDNVGERQKKFASYAADLGLASELFVSDLGDLLGLGVVPLEQSTHKRKSVWLTALERVFSSLAEEAPLLVILEDGHWVDLVTDELLAELAARLAMRPVMILATARPEYAPGWVNAPSASRIDIPRLDQKSAEAMINRIAADRALSPDLFTRIIKTTDGVPLFIEELTRSVLDLKWQAAGEDDAISIPATLQDVLATRLDSTGAAKRTAQIAACIGRVFPIKLLTQVARQQEAAVINDLNALIAANLIIVESRDGEQLYVFRHALIQEAAYQSQTRSRRREVHLAIANAMEVSLEAGDEVDLGTLANHFTAADVFDKAISYWHAAGKQAIERSAEREAIELYRRALKLVERLAPSPEVEAQELALQLSIGPALTASEGYGSLAVRAAFDRAEQLADKLGRPDEMFAVRRGQWMYAQMSADYTAADATARQMLKISEMTGRPGLILEADRALGATCFATGRLSDARRHLEAGVPHYIERISEAHTLSYGDDPGLACLSYLGRALWFLGCPDQSLERCLAALEAAHRIDHPFSLARTYVFVAHSHQLRGETKELIEVATKAAEISDRYGFPFFSGVSKMLWGWGVVESGRNKEGNERMKRGYEEYLSSSSLMSKPWFLMLLADAQRRAGKYAEARRLIDEALAVKAVTGEELVSPECMRVRGAIRFDEGDTLGAATDFAQALDIAKAQSALSCELRAALSMVQIDPTALGLVAEISGRFSEGFGTADLRRAKQLIEQSA
ncbi:adenylate/guanylate cyclase domain-containing protein [Sulfitobacter sp. JB4-11]|uniref:adenylate/guanylate cyclase domain-containing protein n=1 Tax=Sulfitobacter rhodophyticola TaxID=3238304 RepID=UPI003518E9E0